VNGNHGILQNGAGFSGGVAGNGFNLDGINDYVLANASSSLDVGKGGGFTIEGWINPTTVAYQMPIAEFERVLGTSSGADVGVHFYISVPPSGGTGPGCFYANIKGTNGPDELKTKAEVVQFLKDSFAVGHRAAKTLTPENAAEVVQMVRGSGPRLALASVAVIHCGDEYGQMVEYLRLSGIVPPASRGN
jgi:hypothetical protein